VLCCCTGIVVSRAPDGGGWSAPCAAAVYGAGWGLQLGAELTDLVLVLRTEEAVSDKREGGEGEKEETRNVCTAGRRGLEDCVLLGVMSLIMRTEMRDDWSQQVLPFKCMLQTISGRRPCRKLGIGRSGCLHKQGYRGRAGDTVTGTTTHGQVVVAFTSTALQVRAFCGAVHVGVGGSLSMAMGPMGRSADATVLVGGWVTCHRSTYMLQMTCSWSQDMPANVEPMQHCSQCSSAGTT
jgi:hypothetical protein